MSNPMHVDDGDFTQSAQNGPWSYRYPFASKGDMRSFVASRKMRQDAASFTPPVAMTQRTFANQSSTTYPTVEVSSGVVLISGPTTIHTPAVAYLVNITPPVEATNGILEWSEEWASVPDKRLEWGTITYTQLFGLTETTPYQFNLNYDAYHMFEYAVQPDSGFDIFSYVGLGSLAGNFTLPVPDLPTLVAPRVVDGGFGVLRLVGGPGVTISQILAPGVPILAQDSDNEIYMGRIIQRHSVWVVKKALATL